MLYSNVIWAECHQSKYSSRQSRCWLRKSLPFMQLEHTLTCRQALYWARRIQSQPISVIFILILSFHPFLGLPTASSPWSSQINCVRIHLHHAFYSPAHLNFDLIIIMSREEYILWSSSLCIFLHSPVTSSLLGPTLSSAPCSQTPSTCFFLRREAKPHTISEQEELHCCTF
jgi:hypothetical protein